MKRSSKMALISLLGLSAAVAVNAQEKATVYDQPLEAWVVGFDQSALSDALNTDLRRSVERMVALSATGVIGEFARGMRENPDSKVIRSALRFMNLPQRAQAPVILVNGVQAGFPFGAVKDLGDGMVEQTFVFVPAALVRAREKDAQGRLGLAVQMGDDIRTRQVLDASEVARQIEKSMQ